MFPTFVVGDFAEQCLSDVSLCKVGFSVSLWVQLGQIQDNDTHFLISSGEQVTRGFSIYQRDVDRLGAAVTDGRVRWIVEIEHAPYLKDEGEPAVTPVILPNKLVFYSSEADFTKPYTMA